MKYIIFLIALCVCILCTNCTSKEEVIIKKFKEVVEYTKVNFPNGIEDTTTKRIIIEQINPIVKIPLEKLKQIQLTTPIDTIIKEKRKEFDPSITPKSEVADGSKYIIYSKIHLNKINSRFEYEYWIKDNSIYGWIFYSDRKFEVGDELIIDNY